ncbi:Predicted AAA-ATPase [Butyrivibrio fibrisolvens]|uniref:Predicted AAA-ATPase n=1 Tax=Butyrivibrio fibrisolvens TaxID=831 RepID=A0A1H9W4M9_BUTFI|nr:AAA family ATPase [Butyrivibrio fibrisolvens]SES28906.1 Predicted AAA-ATPase [Butyrivibrio fibrisolvens]
MGTFVNPGMVKFETAVNSEIYVDKSGIIEYLNSVINTKSKYICVLRPRRFGKTTTADMVCAYYDSSVDSDKCRHIFEDMRIAKASSFESNQNAGVRS